MILKKMIENFEKLSKNSRDQLLFIVIISKIRNRYF